jgi:hypothetical protein
MTVEEDAEAGRLAEGRGDDLGVGGRLHCLLLPAVAHRFASLSRQ